MLVPRDQVPGKWRWVGEGLRQGITARLSVIMKSLEWRTGKEDRSFLPGYQPSVAALSQ